MDNCEICNDLFDMQNLRALSGGKYICHRCDAKTKFTCTVSYGELIISPEAEKALADGSFFIKHQTDDNIEIPERVKRDASSILARLLRFGKGKGGSNPLT